MQTRASPTRRRRPRSNSGSRSSPKISAAARRRAEKLLKASMTSDMSLPDPDDSATDVTTDGDDEEEVAAAKKQVTLLANDNSTKKWGSWWRRFWMTLLMIGSFFGWLFLARQTGMVVLVLFVQAFIYKELTSLAMKDSKESQLPGFSFFYVYWFVVTVFFIYGRTLMPHLQMLDFGPVQPILEHHFAITYWLYILGIMAFVGSLKKRKLYRYQFKQFAYCHMALLVVVVQSTYLAANVFNGLIWFVLPCSMVVCNDCTAYIFGFFLGKTPLIRLSPKKTWEGFLGGFVSTIVWAFWFTRLLQSYAFMVCPKTGFSLTMEPCDLEQMELARLYQLDPVYHYLPESIVNVTPTWIGDLRMSPLQAHAVFMAVFASLVAPFGGFFASGFKRAFKIKDFGTSLPGHGGFTDRMDCQIIMGLFTYVYYHNVISHGGYAVTSLLAKIVLLPAVQQEELFAQLARHLGKSLENVTG